MNFEIPKLETFKAVGTFIPTQSGYDALLTPECTRVVRLILLMSVDDSAETTMIRVANYLACLLCTNSSGTFRTAEECNDFVRENFIPLIVFVRELALRVRDLETAEALTEWVRKSKKPVH